MGKWVVDHLKRTLFLAFSWLATVLVGSDTDERVATCAELESLRTEFFLRIDFLAILDGLGALLVSYEFEFSLLLCLSSNPKSPLKLPSVLFILSDISTDPSHPKILY